MARSARSCHDTTGSGAGGLITWTFTANDSALAQLAAGQAVHETYTVTLDDQHGGVIAQDVTVTITGTNDAPVITAATSNALVSGNATTDTVGGTVSFTDVDLSDRPTVTAPFASYSYLAADHVTALTLTAAQQSAVETALVPVPAAGNTDNGSASWTYSVSDSALISSLRRVADADLHGHGQRPQRRHRHAANYHYHRAVPTTCR